MNRILQLLAVRTYIENEGMYPQVRKAVPDIESDIPREALGRTQLQEIGAEMLKLRKKAPKRRRG